MSRHDIDGTLRAIRHPARRVILEHAAAGHSKSELYREFPALARPEIDRYLADAERSGWLERAGGGYRLQSDAILSVRGLVFEHYGKPPTAFVRYPDDVRLDATVAVLRSPARRMVLKHFAKRKGPLTTRQIVDETDIRAVADAGVIMLDLVQAGLIVMVPDMTKSRRYVIASSVTPDLGNYLYRLRQAHHREAA